jgi:hypothetical protein
METIALGLVNRKRKLFSSMDGGAMQMAMESKVHDAQDVTVGSPMAANSDADQAMAKREAEVQPFIRVAANCGDTTSFAHEVLEFINTFRDTKPQLNLHSRDAQRSFSLVKRRRYAVFPSSFAHRLVDRAARHWRSFVLAVLYYTQVGSLCGAFRNVFTGIRQRHYRADSVATNEESETKRSLVREVSFTGEKAPDNTADIDCTFHRTPRSPEEMHEAVRRAFERRVTKHQDRREQEALVAYDVHVRYIAMDAFHAVERVTQATQLFDNLCSASPDISAAKVITPSFMQAKMKAIFGAESSFWKPVINQRILSHPKELEEVIVTLSPLAHMKPAELCDQLLRSLDDTDMFFVSLNSQEVDDAFTACLPELLVVYCMYADRDNDSDPPVLSMDSWLSLLGPMYDADFTPSLAESVFQTVARRMKNIAAQNEFLEQRITSVVLMTSLITAGQCVLPFIRSIKIDMDAFCEAVAIVSCYKYPSPFVTLEQKIVSYVEYLLSPLVGAKSRDSRKAAVGERMMKGVKKKSRQDHKEMLRDALRIMPVDVAKRIANIIDEHERSSAKHAINRATKIEEAIKNAEAQSGQPNCTEVPDRSDPTGE